MERRFDGLNRRARETEDWLTSRMRAIDDDVVALSDLVRRQERVGRTLAEAVPGMVAGAFAVAMEAEMSALSASLVRAERVRAATEAMCEAIQMSSERMMETLFRRDQEIDEWAAAHLEALKHERSALAALFEAGQEQLAREVVGTIPAIVDDAVRTAMRRDATKWSASVAEMVARLRLDSDTMWAGLQRSFEDAVAVREHELADRAAAEARAVERERVDLAELRDQVAGSVTEALPALIADAVRNAVEPYRAALDEARQGTPQLLETSVVDHIDDERIDSGNSREP